MIYAPTRDRHVLPVSTAVEPVEPTDGGSNGAIFDSSKFKMAAAAILNNFEWLTAHDLLI